MPRFFYDFFDGDTWSQDEVGLDFPSAEHACLEAFEAARGMWRDLADGRRDPSACAFDIKSDGGESLFRFEFSELLGRRSWQGSDAPVTAIIRKIEENHRRAIEARSGIQQSLEQTLASLHDARLMLTRLDMIERSGAVG